MLLVTLEVPLFATIAPLVPASTVSVPSVTDSVAVRLPVPASTSVTERPVPFRFSSTCSSTEYESGVIVTTGASLTAVTLIVIESKSSSDVPSPVRLGSRPVLPRSLVVSVIVSEPLKFALPR